MNISTSNQNLQESPSSPTVPVELSIVVPVYNEEESLPDLLDKIVTSLEGAKLSYLEEGDKLRYEIICVDDGSTKDGSARWLKDKTLIYPNLKAVLLRRNYGQTAAMAAGFDEARGRTIVTLDADLQNPPEEIPRLLEKLNEGEGYDLVSGWRKNRKDAALTRLLPSKIANWLIGQLTGVKLHDYGCSLKAYRKELIDHIRLYGELHRFLPALAYIEGARIAELPVKHEERKHGVSKYGLGRTFRVVMDLFTVFFMKKFLTRPMHVFGILGIFSMTSGVLMGGYLSFIKLFLNQRIGDRPLLILSVLLVLTGVQLFCFGLLGELLMRTYHESQNRPIYRIRDVFPQEKLKLDRADLVD